MDVEALIGSYGGPGLLLIAFIGATIIPLSSEAALIGAIALGFPKFEALAWATVGNCAGVTLNYWLGRLGRHSVGERTRPGGKLERAMKWFDRYGKWGLLLSWLPIVGDPLTLVAGVIRVNFLFFVVVAYLLRILRYWFVVVVAA